jgi:TonB family protein
MAVGLAQDAKPPATPAPERGAAEAPPDDVVYKEDEVDVKARRKGEAGVKTRASDGRMPYPLTCPERGEATLSVVVHKSGKVTAVTLVEGSGCAVFDSRAVKDAWKLKYTPALKDARPVSQVATLVTRYWWARGRWALPR